MLLHVFLRNSYQTKVGSQPKSVRRKHLNDNDDGNNNRHCANNSNRVNNNHGVTKTQCVFKNNTPEYITTIVCLLRPSYLWEAQVCHYVTRHPLFYLHLDYFLTLSASGQAEHDRVGLLHTLATLEEHPESVPINALVAIEGTPLAEEGKANAPDIWDMGRMIATARVVMPKTMVRLSAGRLSFSEAEQVMLW